MHLKTWIITILGLLLTMAGGMLWLNSGHRTSREAAFETKGQAESEEEEGPNSPEFTSHQPERFRPTRWTSLDDAGTNHRCNQDSIAQEQNETPCVANPLDPEVLVVGANDYRTGNVQAGYYRTTDGGNTWHDALLTDGPPNIQCEFAGDPAIAADATGKFYAIYCTYYCNSQQGVYCQTSINYGTTWTAPVPVGVNSQDTGAGIDKPHATCDISLGSPYLNNCYAAWVYIYQNDNIYFARSTNGGTSFSTPIAISGNYAAWFPTTAVGPNGEVYATWIRRDNPRSVRFKRSLDGGVTWGTDINVHAFSGEYMQTNPCGAYRVPHYTVVACDVSNSPYRGYVYLCWDMVRTGTDANIYFCRSTDGGLTWSDTLRINDDRTTRMQWWPWMTVHPRTGDIGISWLDRRNDPGNCNFDVYGTVSTDGGATWATNFRISDVTDNPRNSGFMGDYTGATPTDLGFFSSWASSRNDVCDAYSAWWNNDDSLKLTSPNGGEVFAVQQPCSVRWQFRYAPDTLYVDLNRTYPSTAWERLDTVRSDSGLLVWFPTEPSTTSARLRITGQHFPTVGDTSDADFAIGMAVPSRVTAYRVGSDIRLRWQSTGAPNYHVYSAATWDGPYITLEGSTTATTFLDLGAADEPLKFYIVTASTEP